MLAAAGARSQVTFTPTADPAFAVNQGDFTEPCWADFENRGQLDLLTSVYGGQDILFQNNGDGTFTPMTAGIPSPGDENVALVAADYDNDGWLDLMSVAGGGSEFREPILLYQGNGSDTFTPIPGGDLANFNGFFNNGVWADYDNDGFVDFMISPGSDSTFNAQGSLFHNNGDGTFTSVTNAITKLSLNCGSAAWVDYDNDGVPDLIICSGGTGTDHSYLFHNDGGGNFTRITTNVLATDSWPDGAWVATWGDYDNDGLPDVYITGMGSGGRLYHNNGNGSFNLVATGAMSQPPTGGGSLSCAWGDFDNDGYLDLVISAYSGVNRLFHNNGDGTFTQVLASPFTNTANKNIYCQTCSWADYDNDGFLDLLITRFPESGVTTNLLYHNGGNSNAWLEVKLTGTVANRAAIGAKVRVHATIGGKSFWQVHEMTTGGGRWAQPLVAHFGLGDATNVDTVRIEWPAIPAQVQEIHNVAARQIITITEPPIVSAGLSNGLPQISVKGGRGFQYDIQTSTDLKTWSLLQTAATDSSGTATILDTNNAVAAKFYRIASH